MKKNITQLTLNRLLPSLLILMLSIIIVIGLNFRSLVLMSMQERVLSITQTIKAGLTAHMKAHIMGKRPYYLHEITHIPHINKIIIIRSDQVCEQFGRCVVGEKRVDNSSKNVFKSKENYFEIKEWDTKASIHAIIPYIATSKGNLNCLQCHHVPENTVLGAVDIELDITEYRNKAWTYLMILFGMTLVLTLIVMINTSYVIERFVREPLLQLIQLAKSVFYHTNKNEYTAFHSQEFDEVATQFIHFGEELKEREERIEQTSIKFKSLNHEIDNTLRQTLFAMGEAEEIRSKETHKHTKRVVEYSRLLGELYGLDKEDIDLLTTAAPLHDIGKIGIPDSILLKPGRLDDEERLIIQMHAIMGYDILKHSEQKVLQAAAIIAHQHHERWDGHGYPAKLKAEDIHIFGRIVAIADVFDALGTKRVYKDAWPLDKVRDYFIKESATAFDPHLVQLLMEHFQEFEELYFRYYESSEGQELS